MKVIMKFRNFLLRNKALFYLLLTHLSIISTSVCDLATCSVLVIRWVFLRVQDVAPQSMDAKYLEEATPLNVRQEAVETFLNQHYHVCLAHPTIQ